jgi:hypothetical protein
MDIVLVETLFYQLNDKKITLLPFTSNNLKKEIDVRGYFILDLKLFKQS